MRLLLRLRLEDLDLESVRETDLERPIWSDPKAASPRLASCLAPQRRNLWMDELHEPALFALARISIAHHKQEPRGNRRRLNLGHSRTENIRALAFV